MTLIPACVSGRALARAPSIEMCCSHLLACSRHPATGACHFFSLLLMLHTEIMFCWLVNFFSVLLRIWCRFGWRAHFCIWTICTRLNILVCIYTLMYVWVAQKQNNASPARDPLKSFAWIYENLWINISSPAIMACVRAKLLRCPPGMFHTQGNSSSRHMINKMGKMSECVYTRFITVYWPYYSRLERHVYRLYYLVLFRFNGHSHASMRATRVCIVYVHFIYLLNLKLFIICQTINIANNLLHSDVVFAMWISGCCTIFPSLIGPVVLTAAISYV